MGWSCIKLNSLLNQNPIYLLVFWVTVPHQGLISTQLMLWQRDLVLEFMESVMHIVANVPRRTSTFRRKVPFIREHGFVMVQVEVHSFPCGDSTCVAEYLKIY